MAGKEEIYALFRAVGEPDLEARREAELALAAIGPSAIPEIVGALEESQATMRWYLARAIVRMGVVSVEPVIEAIRSAGDPDVRRYLTGSLASLGEVAIPHLIRYLADDDVNVRGAVALALCRIGEPAIPGLTEAAEGDDPFLRTCAELVLFRMGEEGIGALFSEEER
ncbi:hypothetical protein RJ53_05455 [Methanocalculus chunghsingensis]|uniref:HEAT repeat domain-containing protein n=1 Tax=Methanocalculus chunghsingensis TaxID=156457 RepID=A0A8J8B5E5_9EURY|nr:HEAT repeat domain-containing protein [Methanocalculus chunghsingensis]MBR1368979.1 hypothetical protein [Methanocalculus chunghsingensis]